MYSIVVTGWISVAGMQTEDWVPLEEHLLLKRANILELCVLLQIFRNLEQAQELKEIINRRK